MGFAASHRPRGPWLVIAAAWLLACGDAAPDFHYPNDAARSVFHVQSRGTHNSYHVAPPEDEVAEWKYTHAPLDEQLSNGVRQFELDLWVNVFDDQLEVYHFFRIDEETTCRRFVDCLSTFKRWSDANRGHHPVVVMVELKDNYDPNFIDHYFELFEAELSSVWPTDRLITPDLIRGDQPSLAVALANDGWPSMEQLRGRFLFFLLASAEYDAYYTNGHSSLQGRLAFVDAAPGMPYAAVTKVDDPIGGADDIRAALDAGMLVRTRVDTLGPNGPELDQPRFDAALSSGAHFLSSDAAGVTIPGGTPSRCNPVTAPIDCESIELENPDFID